MPAAAEEPTTTYSGTVKGRDISHTVDLRPGLVVVRARHAGGDNFQLTLALPRPGRDVWREREEAIPIFNEVGQFHGSGAGRIRTGGTYVLALFASGSYEITIEQPPLADVAAPDHTEFSGVGHQVTPVIIFSTGAHRIAFTHDGEARFGPRGLAQVWLLDLDGNEIGGDVSGRLFNEFGPYEGVVELEVVLEGPHIFHIRATGNWTLRID